MADFDMGFEEFDSTADLEFDIGHSAPRSLVPEKRLSSPIINRLCERLLCLREKSEIQTNLKQHGKRLGRDPTRKDRFRLLATSYPGLFYSSIKRQFMQFAEMLDGFDSEPELLDPRHYPQFFRASYECRTGVSTDTKTATRVYDIAVESLCSQLHDTIKPHRIASLKKQLRVPAIDVHRLHASAATAQLWSDIVDRYRKCASDHKHNGKWSNFGQYKIMFGSDYCALKFTPDDESTGKIVLACYEQLQMIQDATQGRHAIHTALALNLHNGTPRLEHHITTLLAWQDACLAKYGNEGYDLVKAPESVFKARLNSLTNGDILEYSSYDRTIDKLALKEKKICGASPFVDVFDDFASRVTDQGDCVELFGLIKVSGHPCVYAEESARSVRKEAMPVGTMSIYHQRLLVRCFKHIVLSGYIGKHGTWPPLAQLPIRDTLLRRHYNNRITTLPLNSYNLSDLDNVEFEKFIEFDYSEDFLKFLDDKAICPGASEIGNFWFGGIRTQPRRLLTEVISRKTFDTRELVERMRHGRTTREEEVIELTQKERELKIAARCFCKLTFAVRTFFTLTEYNLGEYFMKDYCPQQTMTMSDAQTKSRLYSMVQDSRKRNKVMLEVDFSRWNLRWRDDTVRPIASILEDIYGLPGVFTQAHPFFTRATVVLTDKHTLPEGAIKGKSVHDWPESSLVWRGHLGGFEGIQQKLWTICTIAMMYVCIYDCDVSFIMAGQGDNQIFALTFHATDKDIVRVKLRRLLAVMEVRCFYLNHEVKPEECVDSTTVLTYSKEIYVLGVHKTYSLKFLARTLSVADNDVPSISRELSGISATSLMCADNLPMPFKGFFWLLFQTLQEITYRLKSPIHEVERASLREIFRGNPKYATFALLLPGSLGGLPIQSWGRFFMKGEVDSLSWDVAAVRATAPYCQLLAEDFSLLLDKKYCPPKPNLMSLILDPHSIPVLRPKDKIRLIKEYVSKALPSLTKNEWISEIISDKTEAAGKELLENLTKTTPFHPKILNDLYSYSPAGVRDAMLNRFNMTRTITAVTGNQSFLSEIITGNLQLYRYILNRIRQAEKLHTHPDFSNTQPFMLCSRLRSHWGENVRHQDIGTYTPFDFTISLHHETTSRISVVSRTETMNFRTTIGPYPPNFGTKTRAKTSDHGFKIITSSSTIGDLRALMIIYSELGSTADMKRIIDPLVRARCPWSIDELQNIMPTLFGGTAAHRHDTLQQSAFSVLGSKTVPTHLNFCSDQSGILSGGVLDYPVAFQEHYLFLTNLAQLFSSIQSPHPEAFAAAITVPDCLTPVSTDAITLSTGNTLQQNKRWPMYYRNALIYVTRLQFKTIPLVPSPHIIMHSSKHRSTPSLIFSSCLSKSRTLPGAYKDLKHAIVHPIEPMDICEFVHCTPAHVIEGIAAYVVIESTYQAIRLANRFLQDELHTIMVRIASSVCGSLGRLFLYDSVSHGRYATELGLVMLPGEAGADHVTAKLSGEVVSTALGYIRARTMQSRKFEFIIFEDTTSIAHLCLFKIALSWMTHFRNGKLYVDAKDRLQLVVSQARIEGNARSIIAAESLVNSIRVHCNKTAGLLDVDTVGPHVTYWHTTHNEALRTLRIREVIQDKNSTVQFQSLVRHSSNLGQCKVGQRLEIGSLRRYQDEPNSAEIQRLEVFLHRIHRTVGRFSTAVSFWSHLLPPLLRKLPKANEAISIGVGHGAVASLLLRNGYTVQGVDLRNSFPRITQREELYKPPECRLLEDDQRFSWHHSTFDYGGNIFQKNVQDAVFNHKTSIYVIDIEKDTLLLMEMLASLEPGFLIIARLQCSMTMLQWFLSTVNVQEVRNCTFIRTLPIQNWVVSFITQGLGMSSANTNRTKLEIQRLYRPKLDKSLSCATVRINDLIRETGFSLKEATIPECENCARELFRIATNSNDITIASQFFKISRILTWCVELSRTDRIQDILDFVSRGEDGWRTVCSYLSLSRVDKETIIEDVLSRTTI